VGDADSCVAFLQWALPRLGLRWAGFRRVRRQVCRRIFRRLTELGIADLAGYRQYLREHPPEWKFLGRLCRVTISRFCRDRGVFSHLADPVLMELAAGASRQGRRLLRCWCAGCASGEEVWSVRLTWDLTLASRFPGISLGVVGTDIDLTVLERARRAVYPESSLREVPAAWREAAFEPTGDELRLRDRFRHEKVLVQQDLREGTPGSGFDLVLCRNLAFTYFDEASQRQTAEQLVRGLRPGGILVLGSRERVPEGTAGLVELPGEAGFYQSPTP
jgi:chemotaxis protein methyltransferase CheR